MLEDLKPEIKRGSCRIRTLYETLEPNDAKLLRQYIGDEETWGSWALASALSQRGIRIDHKTIKRHRDKICSCD